MRMQACTWEEIEQYLQQSRAIILPVGSTEQHGPIGLLGTDSFCPERIANEVSQQKGILVAPTLHFGQAQQHMAFPGTMSLRATTYIAVIRDLIQSLVRHGFERFYFINGHGGNTAPLTTAFSEIYADYSFAGQAAPRLRYRIENWWENPAVKEYARSKFGDSEGYHATTSEIAVTQAIVSHQPRYASLDVAPTWRRAYCDSADFRDLYPDGRIGSMPTIATAEHGQVLIQIMIDYVSKDLASFIDEE